MATATGLVRLDVTELRRLLDRRDDTVVLDVRSPGEYETVHLEGSVNFPLDLIEQHSAQVAVRLAGPVVLLCAQGVRSSQAARMLAGAGVADLRVLDGGIGAWESAGGDVRRGRGRWAMERQVRGGPQRPALNREPGSFPPRLRPDAAARAAPFALISAGT